MATSAALQTFKRVYNDPAALLPTDPDDQRRQSYALSWAYYQNSAFDNLAAWASYRSQNRLYRHIRPIYNPARRLADFYAGTVYQGEWATKPERMIEPNAAIPFDEATPQPLLAAIAQLWQWSNWQSKKNVMITHGAALGDSMTIIVDDTARQKVYFDTIWPGHIVDIDLDPTGNVTFYALEYGIYDEDAKRTYTYRREVSKEQIATYRDGNLHAYDAPATVPNPYGFVPAAWTQHTPSGSDHGAPALRNPEKMDELNSLASAAMDQAQRILNAPILIAGEAISGMSASKAGATADRTPDTVDREAIKLMTAAPGATIETIRMEAGETLEHVDRITKEIEADHPELTMYTQMRGMSQITGPAADRIFGDVVALVNGARAQYDQSSVKLFQMATAIAGWRLATGAWRNPTRQHQAFAGYDLSSYERGDLDMAIQSRPLFPPTEAEKLAMERQEIGLEADRAYNQQPGASDERQPASVARRLRAQAEQQQERQPQEARS